MKITQDLLIIILNLIWFFPDIPDQDHHEDILTGQHKLVICGTNLDLTKDERTGPPGRWPLLTGTTFTPPVLASGDRVFTVILTAYRTVGQKAADCVWRNCNNFIFHFGKLCVKLYSTLGTFNWRSIPFWEGLIWSHIPFWGDISCKSLHVETYWRSLEKHEAVLNCYGFLCENPSEVKAMEILYWMLNC